jgi:hypothetical protein
VWKEGERKFQGLDNPSCPDKQQLPGQKRVKSQSSCKKRDKAPSVEGRGEIKFY